MGGVPKVLILGHSFVKRLQRDLSRNFHPRASSAFSLVGTADVRLYGIGGRTAQTLRSYDLHVIDQLKPEVVILEVGTNDLSTLGPEVVGSQIEDLVVLLKSSYFVSVVCVSHVVPRGMSTPHPHSFLERAKVLQQYLEVVLDPLERVFCWRHREFTRPDKALYLRDGVHLNPQGQYLLYRSYRGAILKALSYL